MNIDNLINDFSNNILSKNDKFLNITFKLKNNKILSCITKDLINWETSVLNRVGEFGYISYENIPDIFINQNSSRIKSKNIKIDLIQEFLFLNGIKNERNK